MAETMTRLEHLAWCKRRALEYVDAGDFEGAITSMGSDMGKHPETDSPAIAYLIFAALTGPEIRQADACRRFIRGFN